MWSYGHYLNKTGQVTPQLCCMVYFRRRSPLLHNGFFGQTTHLQNPARKPCRKRAYLWMIAHVPLERSFLVSGKVPNPLVSDPGVLRSPPLPPLFFNFLKTTYIPGQYIIQDGTQNYKGRKAITL